MSKQEILNKLILCEDILEDALAQIFSSEDDVKIRLIKRTIMSSLSDVSDNVKPKDVILSYDNPNDLAHTMGLSPQRAEELSILCEGYIDRFGTPGIFKGMKSLNGIAELIWYCQEAGKLLQIKKQSINSKANPFEQLLKDLALPDDGDVKIQITPIEVGRMPDQLKHILGIPNHSNGNNTPDSQEITTGDKNIDELLKLSTLNGTKGEA